MTKQEIELDKYLQWKCQTIAGIQTTQEHNNAKHK